jgi:hypothetical protein
MAGVANALNPQVPTSMPEDTLEYRILSDYVLNVRGATTDATPRKERHRALSAALADHE